MYIKTYFSGKKKKKKKFLMRIMNFYALFIHYGHVLSLAAVWSVQGINIRLLRMSVTEEKLKIFKKVENQIETKILAR